MSAIAGLGGGMNRGDKGLRLGLAETLRLAWLDDEIRAKLQFVLFIFGLYAPGVHVPVPISGVDPGAMANLLRQNAPGKAGGTLGDNRAAARGR